MELKYDNQLKQHPFYQIHPEYLPFIGDNFDAHRILHIGESHYIDQKKGAETILFSATYFLNWWENECPELKLKCGSWYTTREVIQRFMGGVHSRGYGIFSEVLKMYCKLYLEQEDVKTCKESRNNYSNFAFMNFFQMPSPYEGIKFWNALNDLAKREGDQFLANRIYNETVFRSTEILDYVISVLQPKIVIFTSVCARDAYKKQGKFKTAEYVIDTVHPSCSWWNRPLKRRYQGRTGKQQLEWAWKTCIEHTGKSGR